MKEKPESKEILNPYEKLEGYNCFGCSSKNIHGLKMKFVEEGDYLVCRWHPQEYFSGYKSILHGGIQATLMDEIGSWIVQIKLDTAGFTASLNVKYKTPVHTTDKEITIRAKVTRFEKRLAFIHTELFNENGELCSEGELKFFTYPKEIAKKKMYYPEHKQFYEKED